MSTQEINNFHLFFGYSILLVPLLILFFYRSKLVGSVLIAILRMSVQLVLVGTYLTFLFEYNSTLLNVLWLAIMLLVSAFTIVKRTELSFKYLFLPVLLSLIVSVGINIVVFFELVLQLPNIFDARYLIPISGMILGNCLQNSIIGLRSFYKSIDTNRDRYGYYLTLGATAREAQSPFIVAAFQEAFNPTIASMATIGLVALPGMMTGQILGGSIPMTAIKYQLLIMVAIFSSIVLTVFMSIALSSWATFDKRGNFNDEVLKASDTTAKASLS